MGMAEMGKSNRQCKYTPKCQICDELGHIAKHCPRLRFAEPTANYVATSPATNPKWLIDYGASHNITGDLANLSIHSEYDDTDEVVIGDSSGQDHGSKHVPAMSISHATPVPLTLLLQPPPMPTRGNAIFASSPLTALMRHGTWDLVSPPKNCNSIGCKWVFRVKRNSDGLIDRFKARFVAKGFNQREGLDYKETFNPVVKPATIRTVLINSVICYLLVYVDDLVIIGNNLCFVSEIVAQLGNRFKLITYSDADWVGNYDDWTSTSACISFLGVNPISWSSKKQRAVEPSKTPWLLSLFKELGLPLSRQPKMLCDNLGATHLSFNPVQHSRMKHIQIDLHFV
ncbi:hypothetical protein AAG906_029307 [Vitis piasezkii]